MVMRQQPMALHARRSLIPKARLGGKVSSAERNANADPIWTHPVIFPENQRRGRWSERKVGVGLLLPLALSIVPQQHRGIVAEALGYNVHRHVFISSSDIALNRGIGIIEELCGKLGDDGMR
jgi:hypothetical protein